MWKVKRVLIYDDFGDNTELAALLNNDWEPFTVCNYPTREAVWLRKHEPGFYTGDETEILKELVPDTTGVHKANDVLTAKKVSSRP